MNSTCGYCIAHRKTHIGLGLERVQKLGLLETKVESGQVLLINIRGDVDTEIKQE